MYFNLKIFRLQTANAFGIYTKIKSLLKYFFTVV